MDKIKMSKQDREHAFLGELGDLMTKHGVQLEAVDDKVIYSFYRDEEMKDMKGHLNFLNSSIVKPSDVLCQRGRIYKERSKN